MKRWFISRGTNVESAFKEYGDSHSPVDIFNEYIHKSDYELDNTIGIFDTEAEALETFNKMKSDIIIQRSNYGYEIRYIIVELGVETGNFDEGEWECDCYERIAVAPI